MSLIEEVYDDIVPKFHFSERTLDVELTWNVFFFLFLYTRIPTIMRKTETAKRGSAIDE